MAVIQRMLALAFLPVIALLISQTLYPNSMQVIHAIIQSYIVDTLLFRALVGEKLPPRAETPLVFTAIAHWSHYEKVAKIAVGLAELGYPITFITGGIFEDDVKKLHQKITFKPMLGKPDKMTAEEYEIADSLGAGTVAQELFMMKKVLVESIPDQHETLQQAFSDVRNQWGDSRPVLSLYDSILIGHHAVLLGSPGIKPDTSIGISNHPLTIDSQDTFPFYMGKRPAEGPDATTIHREANQGKEIDYMTREVSEAMWQKLRAMGVLEMHDWHMYHALQAAPDHVMTLGVPEFEFPRSDLRPNVHYFGGLKSKKASNTSEATLPDWWDDVAAAKAAGKQIVAVSQGTVGTDLSNLLLPTLEALKDRTDVLIIATTVAVEVADIPDLVVPGNTRIAKFVPYDLLIPEVDVLINNGGYGAVIQCLQVGVPLVVAGQGQDKNVTNTIVDMKEVGVNLGKQNPSVDEIRRGVAKVLEDKKYKRNAVAMSENFKQYDMATAFDEVIQGSVKKWLIEKRQTTKSL